MVVLVTGANGQLGQALQSISGNYPEIEKEMIKNPLKDLKSLESTQEGVKDRLQVPCVIRNFLLKQKIEKNGCLF